jgi:hypothetical protein
MTPKKPRPLPVVFIERGAIILAFVIIITLIIG